MAVFNYFNNTPQDMFRGSLNFTTAMTGLKVMLSTALPSATMNTSTEITEISTGTGGYVAGGQAITITSAIQTSGAYRLLANALIFTSTAGTIGPFQYAVIRHSTGVTSSTINGSSAPLIGFYDYGSQITLNPAETFTITWDASSGILGSSHG